MTQEDKDLLIKDLCARLSYEVKGIRIYRPEETVTLAEIIPRCKINPNVGDGSFCELGFDETFDCCVITEFKPYLRPMSSMTEEEKQMMDNLWKDNNKLVFADPDEVRRYRFYDISVVDFLNSHHFDYRDLIERGLAIEALEDMYKET